jgi:hypothetical protein
MKKVLLSSALLLISFIGFSQTKGISYQAVIIDPNPIEIPGKDVTAQPYVSKDVWIRFGIYSGTTLQYEELHKTKTDEYGLVNLIIGAGVNTGKAGTFTSLSWDGVTKSIITSVSFDQGGRYTEVSNQKLNYVPYTLLAETAVKLAGVLPIASGGTGATNAIAARTNLGLGNVDNTADADKPVSIATLAILDTKEAIANKSTNIIADSASSVKYPSVKAIKDYVDSRTSSANNANLAAKATALATPRTINGVPFDGTANITIPVGVTPPDANATTKGLVQLAGDLTGTAAAPAIAANSVTTAKIIDGAVTTGKLAAGAVNTAQVADGAITNAKITSVAGSKVTGDIAGNAATATLATTATSANTATKLTTARTINGTPFDGTSDITITTNASTLSGTIGILNGGTGASTAAGARTNLGLVIGTDVLAQRTFGTAANSAATDFVAATEKGANNGVATLGNNGKIPSTQIPAISFQNVNVVNSDAAMIGIAGAQVGSIAIRTDNNNNYVLSALPASTLSNWIALATPLYVSTVNGYAGPNVVLTTNDVAEGTTNKYFTDARVRNAISATAPLNFNTTSGVLSMTAASGSSDGYLSSADFTRFSNKQTALTAGVDYATPSGNITGNAANVTGIVSIANGGTGTSTATGALVALGAEPSANKSNDVDGDGSSITKFPTVKSIKDYVDRQSANAGVADNSITSAKINGTIAIAKGGTGASTAAGARTNLGLVIGTDVMAANATTALTGDVAGSGNGSFATTVNSVGGVSSSTIATLPTTVASHTASITANSNSIATLNTNVAANTVSITANATAIATNTASIATNATAITTEATTARAAELTLTNSVNSNTASITANTNSIATLNTNVSANTTSITAINTNLALKAPLASPAFTGTPTAPTPATNDNSTKVATTEYVQANLGTVSAGTLTGTTLASTITGSSLTSVGTITSGVWSATEITINKGGTGATTAAGALTNLGAEASANKSAATNLGGVNTSDVLFPTQKAVKAYVDAQTAAAGVADGSITNVKLTNSTTILGSTTMTLGGTVSSVTGLTSLAATNLTGTLSGTATALATGRTISTTGDVTYTSGSFDGSANVTGVATLAASGVTSGTYGSSTAIPILTVDTKGRVTSASTTSITAGVSTLTAIAGTSNANGATISGTAFTLTPADATNGGVVTTGTQTFAGDKTFNNNLTVNGYRIGKGGNNIANTIAIGDNALSNNSLSGMFNVAIGSNSLTNVSSGTRNIGIGPSTLNALTSGNFNVSIGHEALKSITSNGESVAIGDKALTDATGAANTAVGNGAGTRVTTGQGNTLLGAGAGIYLTTTSNNVVLGQNAGSGTGTGGANNTTGANSVFIGRNAQPQNDGQTNQVVLAGFDGTNSNSGLGSNTTLIGNSATTLTQLMGVLNLPNTTASTSTSTGALRVGGGAGIAGNVYIGGTLSIAGGTPAAGEVLTSDANGLATWAAPTGVSTLTYSTTGASNGGTISGTTLTLTAADASNPGLISTGTQTIAGAKTFTNTATFNTDISVNGLTVGRGAGAVASNAALGATALNANTSGNYNVAVGSEALKSNTTGSVNVALGAATIDNLTSGNNNTVIGSFAGRNYGPNGGATGNNTTMNNGILLGYDARPLVSGGTDEVVIGMRAIGHGSNTVTLGNSSNTKTYMTGDLDVTGNITSATWSGTAIANNKLANSSLTLGTTNIALGATTSVLSGLSTVTASNFTGALTGNSSTATKLAATKNINGVAFDGSADITITADAGTLTGTALKSTVTGSSLTGVGTITTGTWSASTIDVAHGGTGLTSLTTGYIPYGNGTGALGGTSNLFWDNTNTRLGIGTSTPTTKLEVNGSFKAAGLSYPTSDGTAGQYLKTDGSGNIGFTSSLVVPSYSTTNRDAGTFSNGTLIYNSTSGNIQASVPDNGTVVTNSISNSTGNANYGQVSYSSATQQNVYVQTFTTSSAVNLTSISLNVYVNSSPATVIVKVFNDSDPTNGLTNEIGSISKDVTSTSSSNLETFTLPSSYQTSANGTYTFVVYGISSTNTFYVGTYSSNNYSGGTYYTSQANTSYSASSNLSSIGLTNFSNNDLKFNANYSSGASASKWVDLLNTVDLASNVSGALPVANGGTGATTASAARTNLGLGSLATSSSISNADVVSGAAIAFSKLNITKSDITGLGIQDGLTAGSGISLSSGTISVTGLTTSNLSSSAGITVGQLATSTTNLGSTTMTLGGTVTSVTGLTSVTSTGFTGALTGNASTATKLAATKNINGVAFDGSADITVAADANTLTGTTLASNVVTSSLTSVGTITSGVWSGTAIAISKGGTGATTKAAGFDALSPMTTTGDIIYGGSSGTGTRLAKGTDGQVLTLTSGIPTWSTLSAVTTLGTFTTTTTYANGGTISGSTLTLGAADGTNPGLVTTLAQTIAGAKTFSSDIITNEVRVGKGVAGNTSNTVLGKSALTATSTVTNENILNTAIGISAMQNASGTGSYNTAVGANSGFWNSSGSDNTNLGYQSGYNTTTGSKNVAIGSKAMLGVAGNYLTGAGNNAIGFEAMKDISTSAADNIALGLSAGTKLTTGTKNIFIGSLAGSSISTGATANTTGLNSVLIGYDVRPLANADDNEIVISGWNGTAGTVGLGSNSTLIGSTTTQKSQIYGALTVVPNTATGVGNPSTIAAQNAGGTNTAGGALTLKAGNGTGTAAGGDINITPGTTGTGTAGKVVVSTDMTVNSITVGLGKNNISTNTALGYQTLNAIPSSGGGGFNTAIGYQASLGNTSGSGNVALGYGSLAANTTSSDNTAVGAFALNTLNNGSSSSGNVAVGSTALGNGQYLTYNTAVGLGALNVANGTSGSPSTNNTALGFKALNKNTTGNNNIGIGSNALFNLTTASNNTAIGVDAGSYFSNVSNINATGTNGVYLGYRALPSADALTNEIVIGANSNGNGSNTVTIGNSSIISNYLRGTVNVNTGTLTATQAVNVVGSVNDFLEFNIQNTSTGTAAQSGINAMANNGTDAVNFAWMGINNSTFNNPQTYNIGGANDVSFLGAGNDMYVANASNSKSIIFSTGISTTPYFSEKMRITATGNVGIGTASPTALLEVNGTTKINGAATFSSTVTITSGAGAGKVLTSDATGGATWKNSGGTITTTASSATISTTDSFNYIIFTGSTASQTITLPSASLVGAGREFTIKNVASVSVSIGATAGYLIQDNSTLTSNTAALGIEPSNNWMKVISDGTNWYVMRALF